ncbi:MAG TPA: terminase [Nitrososphaerales archaeon]|nr:terminase [Nitrososphaerales archaeon]
MNIDNALNEALGLKKIITHEIIDPKPLIPRPSDIYGEADADYKYSRENFYSLVERGQAAIDGILEVAKEGEHPRAYEVVGQLIKSVAEVTEKLADLHDKMKKLKEVPNNAPRNVTNALFVGSTKELQRLLKDEHNNSKTTKDEDDS